MARVIKDGKEVNLSIDEVQEGDIIIVKPGEKIPIDGDVTAGYEQSKKTMRKINSNLFWAFAYNW